MSDILLIQPPQWYPVSPYLAVPLLAGQLKKAGFNTKAYDLNAEFFNYLLTKDMAADCDIRARQTLEKLFCEYENADIREIEKTGSYDEKTRCLKYLTIKKFYDEHGEEIPYIIENVEKAVSVTRDKEEFFVPEKLTEAKHIIRLALRLVSMPYAPNEIDFDNYFANPLLNLDWSNIKIQAQDRNVNMFYDYFDKYTDKVKSEGYSIVTIAMTDLSQLVSVFTLASMLKEKTDAKIILGGNYATQIYEDMMKFDEIFISYFDYLVIGDGELALPKLCSYIKGEAELASVPNIVYMDENGCVVSTGFSCEKIDMDELAYPDFSDYDMSKYFTPDPTFPIQLSKGCYWGKCNFCDYAYGQQGYSPKHIGRIVKEIKHYVKTYHASKFIFVDEAIPPKFYNLLATAIVEAGLKINFYSFARLETGYTPEVLENLYRAGARLFLWGYECESPRIMEMMNKGIDVEKRLDILSDARKAGIWNNGLFIFGYPTETLDEIKQTMDVIRNNRDIIPSCTLSNFALKKHSLLKEKPGENGIVDYSSNGEFYTVFKDVVDGVSQQDRRTLRRDFQFSFLDENANSLWSVVFSDFDHLLLYLSKYGCDYVSSYRSEKRICPEFR